MSLPERGDAPKKESMPVAEQDAPSREMTDAERESAWNAAERSVEELPRIEEDIDAAIQDIDTKKYDDEALGVQIRYTSAERQLRSVNYLKKRLEKEFDALTDAFKDVSRPDANSLRAGLESSWVRFDQKSKVLEQKVSEYKAAAEASLRDEAIEIAKEAERNTPASEPHRTKAAAISLSPAEKERPPDAPGAETQEETGDQQGVADALDSALRVFEKGGNRKTAEEKVRDVAIKVLDGQLVLSESNAKLLDFALSVASKWDSVTYYDLKSKIRKMKRPPNVG